MLIHPSGPAADLPILSLEPVPTCWADALSLPASQTQPSYLAPTSSLVPCSWEADQNLEPDRTLLATQDLHFWPRPSTFRVSCSLFLRCPTALPGNLQGNKASECLAHTGIISTLVSSNHAPHARLLPSPSPAHTTWKASRPQQNPSVCVRLSQPAVWKQP